MRKGRTSSEEEEKLRAAWAQFRAALPTEQLCLISLQGLYELKGEVRSPCCFVFQPVETIGERSYKCPRCRRIVWVTADSFFEGIREPIAWRGAIWLFEAGLDPTASDLRTLSGIAYSSCWEICRKLNMVVAELMADGETTVDSEVFRKLVFRRTRMTPAGGHPREEYAESAETNEDDSVSMENFTAAEASILENLSSEPIGFDELCERARMEASAVSATLTILELSGAVERLFGDRYKRTKSTGNRSEAEGFPPEWRDFASDFENHIRATVQGIGRKYLQLYLAGYWCRLDRVKWAPGRLLNACLRRSKIRRAELLEYVTPARVLIAAA